VYCSVVVRIQDTFTFDRE